jgi:hypothetical protein
LSFRPPPRRRCRRVLVGLTGDPWRPVVRE